MNSFGRLFRVTIFGESHGASVGINIDGCPAGIALSEADLMADLARRKSGAKGTTPRSEEDLPEIISGVFNGHTTGAPITIIFRNTNTISKDYSNLVTSPRPGHADYVAQEKYKGYQDYRGGGHFSGRVTLGLVAAGAIAKEVLEGVTIGAKLVSVGGRTDIDAVIDEVVATHDSVGGVVECRAAGLPVGWGEPFFDSVESAIAHIAFAIPATKGIEFGSGFAAATMRGSEHNDAIITPNGKTASNHAGGINGGISNGNELVFRVAIKPTSSIGVAQQTLNRETGQVEELMIKGRHDACIALRVPVVLEAATAIALADLSLVAKAYL
ncbi:chorismate synthase [uncultured Acetobacteroides sp.]|uniref:chorismate synthase n=1 Tax=uncultured Acetobacteroides sp. TaxID=1760811 RepID=UPI0029F57BE4|nr:chorismate synthase [uncultured Acetobacteroides sp.]